MSKRTVFFSIAILVMAALACNAPGLGTDSSSEEPAAPAAAPAENQGSDEAGQPAETAPMTEGDAAAEGNVAPAVDQATADQPLAYPIGIQAGLASLNSYHLIMNMTNNGPTTQDIQETHSEVKYDGASDSRYMWVENVESSVDDPQTSSSIEETYQVGLQTCSVSTYEGTPEAEFSEVTPLAHDMALATSNLFDVSIAPQNPTFVGAETANGIPSNHFTFQVTGLGDYSGQEVTQASGDYWIAQDGQYLVKYTLVMEVRSAPEADPEAEVMYSEYTFDLMESNQPQSIIMPPECAPSAE
jgi:hypothetical protein